MAQGPESKFKFVSPGVFIDEIDNSQIIKSSNRTGPVIIGRSLRGPAMRPVLLQSFSEYVEIFGDPIPGGHGGDVWRDGNFTAPTYAGYAAQAWFKNNSPLTMVRLLGAEHSQATDAGKAGWDMGDVSTNSGENAGAYGLWLMDHTKDTSSPIELSASLAAVFYLKSGYNIELTGSDSAAQQMSGAGMWLPTSSAGEWTAVISQERYTNSQKYTFSLNRNSYNYIRKVFNTNPVLTNTTITNTSAQENYFLGETFDRHVEEVIGTSPTYAAFFGLGSQDGNYEWGDQRGGLERSKTGWFISQHIGNSGSFNADNMQKLFRFYSIEGGIWNQNNVKISIQDMLPASNEFADYGSFTVVVRKLGDSDTAPEILEKFTNCSLNPNSPNYVAKKVGDQYRTWDEAQARYRTYGNYPNASKYIYISMNLEVDSSAVDARFLPFGVFGPERLRSLLMVSGSTTVDIGAATAGAGLGANKAHVGAGTYGRDQMHTMKYTSLDWGSTIFIRGNTEVSRRGHGAEEQPYALTNFMLTASSGGTKYTTFRPSDNKSGLTASFFFPAVPIRYYDDVGGTGPQTAYWGAQTDISGTTRFDKSIRDIIRRFPSGISEGGSYTEKTWLFTLDDIVEVASNKFQYVSGSRNASSIEPLGGTGTSYTAVNGWEALLNTAAVSKFTTLLQGGYDGIDVTEQEPFRNTRLDDGRGDVYTNYAYNSIRRAIDSIADPEVAEYNLAVMPGITNPGLTELLIKTCEGRGDALAIIDLEDDFVPSTEAKTSDESRIGSVKSAVDSLQNRRINSSYACAYYPWVQIRDSASNSIIWAPPSIVALGTLSFSERKRALWFAPAGFTRGGLTVGAAGIPVVGVRQKLTSKDRDKLYEANINPIAEFPAEGIVVFGQKTLQVVPSALDRINVRRLMIYIKKEVSRMAATTLFEQNVQSTWNLFKARIDAFLTDIKVGDGLMDFKVILDETTTTPELIDRNILYAKVFLKPARAIEFIALDFVITDSGASFAD